MRAGLMRDRIELQSPTTSEGNEWGPGSTWTGQGSVWAQVTPMTGSEKVNGQGVQSTITHTIRIRFRPGVASTWRAMYRDKILDFVSVVDVDGLNSELLIDAREYAANG